MIQLFKNNRAYGHKFHSFVMVKYLWQNTKWMQILLHVAAWLIVFSLPYLLISNFDPNRPKAPDSRSFFYLGTLTGLFWIVTFYFNAFI